jgi:uncharacterized protein DUF2851
LHLPSRSSSQSSPPLSEAELADIWQQRSYANHSLVDCCGRHLRVVFAGRRWGGPGPDFVGAVLAQADGTLLRGDIELHRRSSGWTAHRHAADPAYANVILHVVQIADVLALDHQGGHIPTVQLELGPGLGARLRRFSPVPCLRQARALREVVEAAGRERFQARVARFEGDLSVVEADQVVWRGVAEALGFGPNARPFAQLAEAVPWSQATEVVVDRGPVGLAGLLLGTAGLLTEATLPEAHAWRRLQRQLGVRPMLRSESWQRAQVRAANAPAVRCRGLAELAAGWLGVVPRPEPERGPAAGATATAAWRGSDAAARSRQRGGPAEQVLEQLGQLASAAHPCLWPLARTSPWIGLGRAQVIAINVLLPFAAAAGMGEAAEIFERAAGEPSNRVVRYMASQLSSTAGSGIRFKGACHQQGLLQLFAATCASRACERCPARAPHNDRAGKERPARSQQRS